MPALAIYVTARIRPDARGATVEAANRMRAATIAEPGCEEYRFGTALDDPDTVILFEAWRDEAALEAHFATPHMAAFTAQLGAVLVEPPVMQRFEIASSGPLVVGGA